VGAALAFGLALTAVQVARSQVGGDQLNLLARGWLLAARGELVPYGNPDSTEGKVPGPLTSVLVGAPLALWMDRRAPVVLLALGNLAGYLLLDDVVRRTLGGRERALFALLYWLGPWRVYFSGFLWNPSYLFLAGALHAWTAWRLRAAPRPAASFLHVLTLGLALQLHPAAVILVFATLLLAWRRALRLHLPAAAAATLVVAATLLPWLAAVAADPRLLPGSKGFPLRGLLLVFPLLRGVVHWLRYASLSLSDAVTLFDFSSLLPAAAAGPPAAAAKLLARGLAPLSVLPALLANARLARRPRRLLRRLAGPQRGRAWLHGYAASCLLAALLAFALAPTTVMMWQGFAVLHAAALVVVPWAGAVARSRRRRAYARVAPVWAAATVLLLVALALGAPHYRCGGPARMGLGLTLRADHPMLHDLGLAASCPLPIAPDGWWPDVLPSD
jgi:hypothetical protein